MAKKPNLELWQEEAQRVGDKTLIKVITEVRDGQRSVLRKIEDMERRLVKVELDAKMALSAFPGGDVDGHRRYHQSLIDTQEARKKFYTAVAEKTISGLAWSAVVALCMTLYYDAQAIGKYFIEVLKSGGPN